MFSSVKWKWYKAWFHFIVVKRSECLCDNPEGWDEVGDGREIQEGEDICIPMADACWCRTETNTLFQSNHPSIKNKYIFKKMSEYVYE